MYFNSFEFAIFFLVVFSGFWILRPYRSARTILLIVSFPAISQVRAWLRPVSDSRY